METNYTLKRLKLLGPLFTVFFFAVFVFGSFKAEAQTVEVVSGSQDVCISAFGTSAATVYEAWVDGEPVPAEDGNWVWEISTAYGSFVVPTNSSTVEALWVIQDQNVPGGPSGGSGTAWVRAKFTPTGESQVQSDYYDVNLWLGIDEVHVDEPETAEVCFAEGDGEIMLEGFYVLYYDNGSAVEIYGVPTHGDAEWIQIDGPGELTFEVDEDNPNQVVVTTDMPGIYEVAWSVVNGTCNPVVSEPLTIEFYHDVGVSLLVPELIEVCEGEEDWVVELEAQGYLIEVAKGQEKEVTFTYQWYFNGSPITGATGPVYEAEAFGEYQVTATANGCTSDASEVIEVAERPLPVVFAEVTSDNTCYGEDIEITFYYTWGTEIDINGEKIAKSNTIFFEDFSDPADWTVTPAAATALNKWAIGTSAVFNVLSPMGGNYAYINSDAAGSGQSQNTWLISPAIDLSGYAVDYLELSFDHHYRPLGGFARVLVSEDGTNWEMLANYTTQQGSYSGFSPPRVITSVPVNLEIEGFEDADEIYLAFQYTGNWSWWWLIDNIQLDVFEVEDYHEYVVEIPGGELAIGDYEIDVVVEWPDLGCPVEYTFEFSVTPPVYAMFSPAIMVDEDGDFEYIQYVQNPAPYRVNIPVDVAADGSLFVEFSDFVTSEGGLALPDVDQGEFIILERWVEVEENVWDWVKYEILVNYQTTADGTYLATVTPYDFATEEQIDLEWGTRHRLRHANVYKSSCGEGLVEYRLDMIADGDDYVYDEMNTLAYTVNDEVWFYTEVKAPYVWPFAEGIDRCETLYVEFHNPVKYRTGQYITPSGNPTFKFELEKWVDGEWVKDDIIDMVHPQNFVYIQGAVGGPTRMEFELSEDLEFGASYRIRMTPATINGAVVYGFIDIVTGLPVLDAEYDFVTQNTGLPEGWFWTNSEYYLVSVDVNPDPTDTADEFGTRPDNLNNVVFSNDFEDLLTYRMGLDLPYEEDFTGVPVGQLPSGWERTHTNWGVANSSNAGGEAPELRFTFTSGVDLFRVQTPILAGEDFEDISLSFRHMVNDYFGDYDLRVETSLDGVTWDTQWELAMKSSGTKGSRQTGSKANVPATLVNLDLAGVDNEDFYLAFVLDGNAWNINWWYIDDIVVSGTESKSSDEEYNVVKHGPYLVDYTEGNFTFTAVEGEGYLWQNWRVNGQIKPIERDEDNPAHDDWIEGLDYFPQTFTFRPAHEDVYPACDDDMPEYIANFRKRRYDIDVVAVAEDHGTVTGGNTYNHGETVTLTALPEPGYYFMGWDYSELPASFAATVTYVYYPVLNEILDPAHPDHTAVLSFELLGPGIEDGAEFEVRALFGVFTPQIFAATQGYNDRTEVYEYNLANIEFKTLFIENILQTGLEPAPVFFGDVNNYYQWAYFKYGNWPTGGDPDDHRPIQVRPIDLDCHYELLTWERWDPTIETEDGFGAFRPVTAADGVIDMDNDAFIFIPTENYRLRATMIWRSDATVSIGNENGIVTDPNPMAMGTIKLEMPEMGIVSQTFAWDDILETDFMPGDVLMLTVYPEPDYFTYGWVDLAGNAIPFFDEEEPGVGGFINNDQFPKRYQDRTEWLYVVGCEGSVDLRAVIGLKRFHVKAVTLPDDQGDLSMSEYGQIAGTAYGFGFWPEDDLLGFDFGTPQAVLLNETFSGLANGQMPEGWQRTHTNWGAWNTSDAGGEAPELRFNWLPSGIATFRAVTPLIDADGVEEGLSLEFLHSLRHYSGSYSIKVQTSPDGETWTDEWVVAVGSGKEQTDELNRDESMKQYLIYQEAVEIDLEHLGGESFHIAFVFDGNSFNLWEWVIDNVRVAGDILLEKDEEEFFVHEIEGWFEIGDNVSLVAEDTGRWKFWRWWEGGVPVYWDREFNIIGIDRNYDMTAQFYYDGPMLEVNLEAYPPEAAPLHFAQYPRYYPEWTTVNVNAAPVLDGWEFVGWVTETVDFDGFFEDILDEDDMDGEHFFFVVPDLEENTSVTFTAVYEKSQYVADLISRTYLRTESNDVWPYTDGNPYIIGELQDNSEIFGGVLEDLTGQETYEAGDVILLRATPNPGFRLVNWMDGEVFNVNQQIFWGEQVNPKVDQLTVFPESYTFPYEVPALPTGTTELPIYGIFAEATSPQYPVIELTTTSNPAGYGETYGDGHYAYGVLAMIDQEVTQPGYVFSHWTTTPGTFYYPQYESVYIWSQGAVEISEIVATAHYTAKEYMLYAYAMHYVDEDEFYTLNNYDLITLPHCCPEEEDDKIFQNYAMFTVEDNPIDVSAVPETMFTFQDGYFYQYVLTHWSYDAEGLIPVQDAQGNNILDPDFAFIPVVPEAFMKDVLFPGDVTIFAQYERTLSGFNVHLHTALDVYTNLDDDAGIAYIEGTDDVAFPAGEDLVIVAEANDGYTFKHWVKMVEGQGQVHVIENIFNFTVPEEHTTFIAVFDINEYELTVTAEPAAGGEVTGGDTYTVVDEVTVTAVANTGWEFIEWTDDEGVFVSDEAEFTFMMPASDWNLVAHFEMIDYELRLAAVPTEGGEVEGEGIFNYEDPVTVTATPALGWEFVSWEMVDELPAAETVIFEESFDEPADWTATHTNWAIVQSNNAGGEAAPELRFNWSPQAIDTFRAITPLLDASGLTDITLSFMHSVNDFSGDYTLKVQTSPDGEVWTDQWELYINGDKEAGSREAGSKDNIPPTEMNLELEGVDGEEFHIAFVYVGNSYNINWWYIDDVLVEGMAASKDGHEGDIVSTDAEYTFPMPAEDLNLVANFQMTEFEVSLVPNVEGAGILTGAAMYLMGDEVTVTATANEAEGFSFDMWTDEDGAMVSDEAEFSFIMPANDVTLIAVFDQEASSVAGQVRYYNQTGTAMPAGHFYIRIKEEGASWDGVEWHPVTFIDNKPSSFLFEGLEVGTYHVQVYDSGYTDGLWPNLSVTATDALIIQNMGDGAEMHGRPWLWINGEDAGYTEFGVNLANVNLDDEINVLDAYAVLQRVVGQVDSFEAPDFQVSAVFGPTAAPRAEAPELLFDYLGGRIFEGSLDVVFGDHIVDIFYIATADMRARSIPQQVKASNVEMEYSGVQYVSVGDQITLPISLTGDAQLGAHTIDLYFNSNLIDVYDVSGEGVVFDVANERITIASIAPLSIERGETLVEIHATVKGQIFDGDQLFQVAPRSELATSSAEVIEGINFSTNAVSTEGSTDIGDVTMDAFEITNFPNPFSNQTTIRYILPEAADVTLVVYNQQGQVVRTLVNEKQEANVYEVVFERESLNAGIYLYRIVVQGESGTHSSTNSMVIMQ